MVRTTATLPSELIHLLEGAVELGAFQSKSNGIQQALTAAFEDEYIRIAAARALHDSGDLEAREAFELANVTDEELRAALAEDLGVQFDDLDTGPTEILESIYQEFSVDQSDPI